MTMTRPAFFGLPTQLALTGIAAALVTAVPVSLASTSTPENKKPPSLPAKLLGSWCSVPTKIDLDLTKALNSKFVLATGGFAVRTSDQCPKEWINLTATGSTYKRFTCTTTSITVNILHQPGSIYFNAPDFSDEYIVTWDCKNSDPDSYVGRLIPSP